MIDSTNIVSIRCLEFVKTALPPKHPKMFQNTPIAPKTKKSIQDIKVIDKSADKIKIKNFQFINE